ncbi:hypothetical protein FBU30_001212 [Linnemannia zychae]|nr:hypothetical protein FBU30_001212 [Linnemannia zychae]
MYFKLADDVSQFKLNLWVLKHLLTPSNWDDDGNDDGDEVQEAEELGFSQRMPTTPLMVQLRPLQTSSDRVNKIRPKSTFRDK